MAKIFIDDIQVEAIIGILPHERAQKQPLIISLELLTDISKAATTENLDDTCDYYAITQRIIEYVVNSEFKLLEALAENLAQLILQEFKVRWLQLKICKPKALSMARNVGIIIERTAEKMCENI